MLHQTLTAKTWTKISLIVLLFIFISIIGVVLFIDPFEIYHQATLFTPPIESGTQIYSNAGIAKNYVYDSVIIGSSMTENFIPSQLDSLLGGSFIKLCVNGGSPYDHRRMMDVAFKNQSISRILYCIDIDAFTFFYKHSNIGIPEYLYDDIYFNDVYYWFNRSVLAKYIPLCLESWGTRDPSIRDTMYNWGNLFPYGAEYALRDVDIDNHSVFQSETPPPFVMEQATLLNVENNIIPYIEAHPSTDFIFFYPPYSLVRWYKYYRDHTLAYHLSQAEAVTARLIQYPNVHIFDFRAKEDWITDLSNYIDDYHYGPWINSLMVQSIASGNCKIDSLQIMQDNSKMIVSLINQIVSSGNWPDSFNSTESF